MLFRSAFCRSIGFISGHRFSCVVFLLVKSEANVVVVMILQRYMQMHNEVELSALGMGKLLCPSGLFQLFASTKATRD